MLFKNAMFYELGSWELDSEELETALLGSQSRDCGKFEVSTKGWFPPVRRSGKLFTHVQGNFTMLCLRTHKKVIDISAVNEAADKKVRAIEENENRKVHSKERAALKDQVLTNFLPDAQTKSSYLYGYVDTRDMLICIDASSPGAAEEFLSLLRETIGSLTVTPIQSSRHVGFEMKTWIQEPHLLPDGVLIGDSAKLQAIHGGGTSITFQKDENLVDSLLPHLDTCEFNSLQLHWDNALTFVLTSDLNLKGIKFFDEILENAAEAETEAQLFDSNMAILCPTLSNIFLDLKELFDPENSKD